MRSLLTVFFLSATLQAAADERGYRLRLDSTLRNGTLTLHPHVRSEARAALRYEVVSERQGPAGTAKTGQSGRVTVPAGEWIGLSTLSFNVGPGDRYVVTVRVLDGPRVVAEQVLKYP